MAFYCRAAIVKTIYKIKDMNIKQKIKQMKIYCIYEEVKSILRYIKYCYQNLIIKMEKKKIKVKFYMDDKVIDKIINENKSLVRYGDGEFFIMWKIKGNGFQEKNDELGNRLKEIIESNNKNILIGISKYYFYQNKKLKIEAKEFFTDFVYNYSSLLNKTIDINKIYADSTITRPYMDYKFCDIKNAKRRFDNLKKIWQDRNVIIVEGEYTRFGRNNDFLDNAKSIERIICPSKNAFNVYKSIENAISKQDKRKLILLALGQTATVVGYDMSLKGYQCVDIGHADVEYMWFKMRAKDKVPIKGKYVNEAGENDLSEENFVDIEYEKQIIERITLDENEN